MDKLGINGRKNQVQVFERKMGVEIGKLVKNPSFSVFCEISANGL